MTKATYKRLFFILWGAAFAKVRSIPKMLSVDATSPLSPTRSSQSMSGHSPLSFGGGGRNLHLFSH